MTLCRQCAKELGDEVEAVVSVTDQGTEFLKRREEQALKDKYGISYIAGKYEQVQAMKELIDGLPAGFLLAYSELRSRSLHGGVGSTAASGGQLGSREGENQRQVNRTQSGVVMGSGGMRLNSGKTGTGVKGASGGAKKVKGASSNSGVGVARDWAYDLERKMSKRLRSMGKEITQEINLRESGIKPADIDAPVRCGKCGKFGEYQWRFCAWCGEKR